MQCPNCGKETKGIKINKKLFCTNCGEPVSDETKSRDNSSTEALTQASPKKDPIEDTSEDSVVHDPKAKLITKEGDEITEKDLTTEELSAEEKILEALEIEAENKELETLEAEKEILDLMSKKREKKKAKKKPAKKKREVPEITNKKIKKHNRPRLSHKPVSKYKIIIGEPDPITTPELKFPEDDQLESPIENVAKPEEGDIEINLAAPEIKEKESYPLGDKGKGRLKEADEKDKAKQKAVSNYFKSTITDIRKDRKEINKSKKFNLVLLILLGILLLLALIITGLSLGLIPLP